MSCYLYVLRCADGSTYTGTYRGEDILTRVGEHNSGHYRSAYTASRRPVTLAYAEPFASIADAVAAERQVKGWNRAKEAMIARRWTDLPWLAKRPGARAKAEGG